METWNLDIIEVHDPWNFLARKEVGDNVPDDFTEMIHSMTSHLDLALDHGQPAFLPAIGEVCAAQKRDGTWHRVSVEGIDTAEHGRKMKCYLIDKGVHQNINTNRLHKLPTRFRDFPARVYKCRLAGVHPLMLGFDETDSGLGVQHVPGTKWDSASVQFMDRTVEESCSCRGEIMRKGSKNSLHVRLHLNTGSDWLCLNDELVRLNFAMRSDGDDDCNSPKDHSSFNSESSGNNISITPNMSKSEDCSDMPSLSLCSESDSETNGEKKRRFIQDNLKRSQLLSPSKISKMEGLEGHSNNEGMNRNQNNSTGLLLPTPASLSLMAANNSHPSSILQKDRPTPTQGIGRAALHQILSGLRPGRISSSSPTKSNPSNNNPNISSILASKSILGQSTKSSQKLNSNSVHQGVSFSDVEPTDDHSSSRKSFSPPSSNLSPPPLSSTPISSALSSSSPPPSSSSVSSMVKERDSMQDPPRQNGVESDSTVPLRMPSEKDFIGTGAKPKVRISSPPKARYQSSDEDVSSRVEIRPQGNADVREESQVLIQPRHRKNLASELMKNTDERNDSHVSIDKEKLVGKMEGQRLLQRLWKKSGLSLVDTEMALPKTMRPDKPQVFPSLGTFAYGKGIPMGVYNVTDYPFVPSIKKILRNALDRELAQGIEAYMWPAILAGRNVVGVSQARVECEMAYIPPLLSLISDKKEYMALPHKMGPLVLVIVPSWRRARQVYDLVETFTGGDHSLYENKHIRTIALYAGGTEESPKTEIALIRGCEILVSTPGSLLRTVSGGAASLKRVCHLVLDNADILANRFQEEVSSLMQMFSLVVKERRDLTVPQQVMLFAKKWTDGLDNFRMRFTKQPVMSFSSRLEASVYGDVKQVVMMCRSQQRLSKLSDLIDTLSMSNTDQRVIVWTSEIEEAMELSKTINSRGVYCLLTHHGIESDHHLEEIRQRWQQSANSTTKLVVLVATDPCYQDLAITDATTVIHYDMPQSKTRFGNRLACMFDHFSDRLTGFKSDMEPVSHVILTEQSGPEYAQSFFDVVKRCKSESYKALEKYIEGYVTGMQTKEDHELCPSIKSFGFCLNEDRCRLRHVLVPERDLKTGETTNDTLPVSGEVKIKVLRVVSANHFYCRLLEHRSPDNSRKGLKEDFQSLTIDLALFFSKESNHVPYLPPQRLNYLGNTTLHINHDEIGLCGFKTDNGVHRARVAELKEGTRAAPMKQCRVWLVDEGCHKTGTIDQLVKLPQRLAEVPYQAVEVIICRIKPIDKEAEWTDRADIFVNEMVKDKILVGRIILRLGMSMWLDPLVHQVMIKKIGPTNDLVIRQEILTNNYASPNPEHLQLLCELCRGKVEIPETVMQKYFDFCLEMELTQESLPVNSDLHQVNIAAIISPGLFYIQKWESIEEMERLEAKINQEMESEEHSQEVGKKSDAGFALGVGSVAVAKSEDGKWYRTKIISSPNEDEWEVFFLDYGDRQNVSREMVRPLSREYGVLPCQAIECEMAGIEHKGEEWLPETVDVMCDLSYYVDGEKKRLSVKVHSTVDESFSLAQRLVVDVFGSNDVWFAEELVWRHLAVAGGGEDKDTVSIKPILEKPALKNQLFFNPWDKVPYLCANLYWAKESSESCALAKELSVLLTNRTDRWDDTLIERELLPALVQIIGYVPDVTSHGLVLDALVQCCLDSDKLCEVVVGENVSLSLSLCLEQVSRRDVQTQAATAVAKLLSKPCFLDSAIGMESIFIDFLRWHSQDPLTFALLDQCCQILCSYIEQESQGSFLESHEEVIFSQTTESLSCDGDREELKQPWLHLLSTLAAANNSSVNRKLIREATIKLLLQLLQTLHSSVCISYLLLILQSMVENSKKYKMVLLEHGLQPALRQVCNRLPTSSPQHALGQKLLLSLVLHFPAQEGLAGRRIEDGQGVHKVSLPPVAWTETCFKVQLKVKVKNATVEDFEISPNNLKCCVLSEGTLFQLDWDLYGRVIPSKCRVDPYSGHTVVSLRKETKGKWGRFLKQKNKPANLSPDFDYLYDSEEEEEEEDENSKRLTRRKKGIFDNLENIHPVRLYSSEDDGEDSDELAIYSNSDNDDPKIDYEKVMLSCLASENH